MRQYLLKSKARDVGIYLHLV